MAGIRRKPSDGPVLAEEAGAAPAPDTAPLQEASAEPVEIWLEHRLRWLYGAVLAEPIPPELLRMLEE